MNQFLPIPKDPVGEKLPLGIPKRGGRVAQPPGSVVQLWWLLTLSAGISLSSSFAITDDLK